MTTIRGLLKVNEIVNKLNPASTICIDCRNPFISENHWEYCQDCRASFKSTSFSDAFRKLMDE